MSYETYKLGKQQKYTVKKLYTHEELEQLDLPRLREICNAGNIKPPTLQTMDDKKELVELIYRYFGTVDQPEIYKFDGGAVSRLEAMLAAGTEQSGPWLGIPSHMKIYKDFRSFDEEDCLYKVTSGSFLLGRYGLLVDSGDKVLAIVTLTPLGKKKEYRLGLDKNMMSKSLGLGSSRDKSLLLFPEEFMGDVLGTYHGMAKKKSMIPYIKRQIGEVWVTEVPETEEVLVIDYGTSYTTAGTYHHPEGTTGRIRFTPVSDCTRQSHCGQCGLCPSVVAVKSCTNHKIEFIFGHGALKEERARGYISKNSIFYDTKRWVSRYKEKVQVRDLDGNTCEVQGGLMVGAFLSYIIKTAEQQNKVRYKNIYLTSPVKQKAHCLKMYQDVLPGYTILTQDMIDEAMAVVYQTLDTQIEDLDYESGQTKHILILDCGGGTSDLVQCDYTITDLSITSQIHMGVQYSKGDTNFGGNNLTYRILQYIKIRLAEYYRGEPHLDIQGLLPGVLGDMYGFVDQKGVGEAYRFFDQRYAWAEEVIPTHFYEYKNSTEDQFLKVKGNYYFLWDLAEKVKKGLFSETGVVQIVLGSYFKEWPEGAINYFNLSVRGPKGILEVRTACPVLTIYKEEVDLLLLPDIYRLIRDFIEPYYLDGSLSGIDQIYLSGQTSKINLFRDVLKEFIAGRKARADGGDSCSKKFLCVDGAIAYQGAKKLGRIRPVIEYASPLVPYNLTAPDFHGKGREACLIEGGSRAEDIYGLISRPLETEEIIFTLKDMDGEKLNDIVYKIGAKEGQGTTYGFLLQEYVGLRQEDIDNIIEGEVKLFILSDNEGWGFSVLEVSRTKEGLYQRPPMYVPFEGKEWEKDFYDGLH